MSVKCSVACPGTIGLSQLEHVIRDDSGSFDEVDVADVETRNSRQRAPFASSRVVRGASDAESCKLQQRSGEQGTKNGGSELAGSRKLRLLTRPDTFLRDDVLSQSGASKRWDVGGVCRCCARSC